jgi:predicted RNA-binding protein with RPS1 domain
MRAEGLTEVADPSGMFLSERSDETSGTVVFPAVEGTRPLLVEVQALVSQSFLAMPRRTTLGVDYNRVILMCAILEKKAGVSLYNQDVFVKVIDIDLERRRISLSLKQATEEVNPEGTDFNPALYGLATDFDDQGNYKYPEGFDSATSEWKPGFEDAKAKWEKEYSEANARWEEHKKQVKAANELAATLPDAKPEVQASTTTSSSSEGATGSEGTLAGDTGCVPCLAPCRYSLAPNVSGLPGAGCDVRGWVLLQTAHSLRPSLRWNA